MHGSCRLKNSENFLNSAATIIEVDIDRPWGIKYSNGDVPYPIYYVIRSNEYNYTNVEGFRE